MIRAHIDALKGSTSRHILTQAWEESESGLKCCKETTTQGDDKLKKDIWSPVTVTFATLTEGERMVSLCVVPSMEEEL